MNWFKRGISQTAYNQTVKRLTFIQTYIKANGFGQSMEKQYEWELESLEKLQYGSLIRKVHLDEAKALFYKQKKEENFS